MLSRQTSHSQGRFTRFWCDSAARATPTFTWNCHVDEYLISEYLAEHETMSQRGRLKLDITKQLHSNIYGCTYCLKVV